MAPEPPLPKPLYYTTGSHSEQKQAQVESTDSIQTAMVRILALLPVGSVILSKLLHLSVPLCL